MKKNKGYTREYKNDDSTTALSHIDQQRAMLLDTIDDEIERKKIKKINKFVEPQLNKDLNSIAESRLRYESRKTKTKPPEFFEKNFGLAGILQVSKRKK
jgi:hypothetical protein